MAGGLIFFYIHPDDEIAAAGLLCKLIGKNIPVHLVLGTCGHGGGEAKPGKTVGETREEEMKASAKVLGADTLDIWDYIDPEWDGKGRAPEHDPGTFRKQVKSLCEKYQVEVVLGHGSSGEYNHLGHIAWHQRVKEAVEAMQPGGPVMYSLGAHAPEKIPVEEGKGNINDLADFVIDVTEYQEFKKMALRCHESQPYSKSDAWKRQYEAYHRQVPKTEGPPDDKMREWLEEEATS